MTAPSIDPVADGLRHLADKIDAELIGPDAVADYLRDYADELDAAIAALAVKPLGELPEALMPEDYAAVLRELREAYGLSMLADDMEDRSSAMDARAIKALEAGAEALDTLAATPPAIGERVVDEGMVERAAKALYDRTCGGVPEWGVLGKDQRWVFLEDARTCLTAALVTQEKGR